MAIRLPDGSIKLRDGRVVFANSLVQAQDLLEILELVVPGYIPAPLWPFISGGGGGGSSGVVGADGADGAPGADGVQGNQGFQGPGTGTPGSQGPQGNDGVQGFQGVMGAGFQGNQGSAGAQGNQGDAGVQGNQGNQGATGAGAQGNQGDQGNDGAQGFQGVMGAGFQGAQGNDGAQGNQGIGGTQGSQGSQGVLNPDIFAATRVVSLTPGEGTDLTVAAAVAALPAIGGTIFIKQGVYPIASPIVIPPGKSIVFQGAGSDFNNLGEITQSPTILDISGTAGIALFNQDIPGALSRSTCYFRDFSVRGDNLSAQKFIELTGAGGAGMQIECRNVVVYRVRDIINTIDGVEAYFYACNLQPALLGNASFYRNLGNGGELTWDGVDATIGTATTDAIISAGTNVDWLVTDSYVGGPSASTFTVNLVIWNNFRLDAAIVNADANVRIEQCELINVSITAAMPNSIVDGSVFISGSPSGYNLRFSAANNVVSDNAFNGGTTTAVDVLVGAVNTVVSGNLFVGYTQGVLTASTGTVATGNSGLNVTETGAANANRFADIVETSTIIGTTTIVTDWNTRDIATTPVTLDITHRTVLSDATGGARVVNLPTAASARYRVYTIKKIDASVNTVTIDGSGAETIDGATTQVLTAQYQSVTIQSNGTSWSII